MLLVKHIGDENQVTDRAKIDTKLFLQQPLRNLENLEVLDGAVS